MLWLPLRPYLLSVFILDSFRRMVLRCLECKPPLSAWPRHTLVTSRITQTHAVPRVQHSSLTANRHNIYILQLHHIKKRLADSTGKRRRDREGTHHEKGEQFFPDSSSFKSKENVIKLTWPKCTASLLMSLLQMKMLWIKYRVYFCKAHTVLH